MRKALSKKNLWEASPSWLKNTVGAALAVLPADIILGKKFRHNLRFAREAERWPAARAKEYQLQHLKGIVRLAYEKSEFYKKQFDLAGFKPEDLRSLEDLASLPTITKNVIVENLARMMTKPAESSGTDYVSTGGSSGTQLRFYIDADRSAIEFAYLTASWERCGYQIGKPTGVIRGQIVKPGRAGLRHEYDPILHRHYYSNFHMDNESIQRYLKHIESIGPCFLLVYPSSALALAQFLLQSGMRFNGQILGILAGSENVYPDQRLLVEKAFSSRLFSWYGHSEKLVLAAECEGSSDYHVWPTYGYCELLAEDGTPVRKPGQRGEIVGTGFINTITPFIRYRTGDYAEYVGEKCVSCGREMMILKEIRSHDGRGPRDNLVGKNGDLISSTTVNVHDDTFEKIREYQFRQAVPGLAILSVVPLGELTKADQKRIIERMNKRLQGQVVLELEIRSELVKTERGKISRVIKEGQLAANHAATPGGVN